MYIDCCVLLFCVHTLCAILYTGYKPSVFCVWYYTYTYIIYCIPLYMCMAAVCGGGGAGRRWPGGGVGNRSRAPFCNLPYATRFVYYYVVFRIDRYTMRNNNHLITKDSSYIPIQHTSHILALSSLTSRTPRVCALCAALSALFGICTYLSLCHSAHGTKRTQTRLQKTTTYTSHRRTQRHIKLYSRSAVCSRHTRLPSAR